MIAPSKPIPTGTCPIRHRVWLDEFIANHQPQVDEHYAMQLTNKKGVWRAIKINSVYPGAVLYHRLYTRGTKDWRVRDFSSAEWFCHCVVGHIARLVEPFDPTPYATKAWLRWFRESQRYLGELEGVQAGARPNPLRGMPWMREVYLP